RKARKVKDPNAPRRPASSYILFQNDVRPSLRETFPGLTHTELMTRVSKLWAELPAEKK
ncbi:high mobility group box domain-containing protein, partial [Vararia minispora EC-137]